MKMGYGGDQPKVGWRNFKSTNGVKTSSNIKIAQKNKLCKYFTELVIVCNEKFNQSKSWGILFFVLFGTLVYILLVNLFAVIYFSTDSIETTIKTINPHTYLNSLYFSFVSFLTIGYGDLYTISQIGKEVLFVESIFSILFNALFSGGLIYTILRRTKNIIVSNKLNLRIGDNEYIILQRIGNMGSAVINCQTAFNVYKFNNNVRQIIFSENQEFPIMEKGVSLFEINHPKGTILINEIHDALANKSENFTASLIVIGTDSNSGQPISIQKYYTIEDICFIKYLPVLTSWENGKSKKIKWAAFNDYTPLNDNSIQNFITAY